MTIESNDQSNPGTAKPRSSPRGFAAMSQERQREIARQGGRAAHQQGKAHQFTSEEARAAGRRSHEIGSAHRFTSEEARKAGRKGGENSRAGRATKAAAPKADTGVEASPSN